MTPWAPLRDPALALDLAERAVRLEPNNPTCWAALGLARYRTGRWAEAVGAIEKCDALAGSSTTTNQFLLSLACSRLGDRERARRCYRQALANLAQGDVPTELQDELDRLRAEAAALLGLAELPADVFARP